MPYIAQSEREAIDIFLEDLMDGLLKETIEEEGIEFTPGVMNYIFTRLANRFIVVHGERYANHNHILGVFDAAGKEWYRRKVAPYEDKAIEKNGDL